MVNYNQTCARFLVSKAEEKFKDDVDKLIMIKDIYIKVKSYALLNKLLFLILIIFSLSIFIFPSLLILEISDVNISAFNATILQSVLAIITGGNVYLYKDYKNKQNEMEGLLRKVFYLDDFDDKKKKEVIQEINSIDVGFRVPNFE